MNIAIAALAVLLAVPSWCAVDVAPTDAEMSGTLAAANRGEIDAAKIAVDRSGHIDVKRFAERMLKDHEETREKLDAVLERNLIRPVDSLAGEESAKHGGDVVSELSAADGRAFDKTYIDDEVADHETLLMKIDGDMIPNAQNPDLRALLRKVRITVAYHLELARKLQSDLKKD
jgi:putative membrane protein